MLKSLLRDRKLVVLFFISLLIKLFSLREDWVERYYTYGIYPPFSRALRFLTGWLPISLGDLLYIAAFVYLVLKTWKWLRILARRQVKEYLSHVLFARFLKLVMWIYLVFNLFWGLNYNRLGIAEQLGLEVTSYGADEVYELTSAIQEKLNVHAQQVDSLKRKQLQTDEPLLFREGILAYQKAKARFPFLEYEQPSIKPSSFSSIGHFFGFTGYYNPFTGEAQLKTSVPIFVQPFILCHEMAHQLGYAKENEANLVAFFSGRLSSHSEFVYSAYYDIYVYAARELMRYDTARFLQLRETVHPQVKKDYQAYRAYLARTKNSVEPIMSDFYDRYLKMNNQPKGRGTYNEVVAWLIAYMKKFGRNAI